MKNMNKKKEQELVIDLELSMNEANFPNENLIENIRKIAKRLNVSYQKFFLISNGKIELI